MAGQHIIPLACLSAAFFLFVVPIAVTATAATGLCSDYNNDCVSCILDSDCMFCASNYVCLNVTDTTAASCPSASDLVTEEAHCPSATPTASGTPSSTPTGTASSTITGTSSTTASGSPSNTATTTASGSSTASATSTGSITSSKSTTASSSPSATVTGTSSGTGTSTGTMTISLSATGTETATPTPSVTSTVTDSPSAKPTQTSTLTGTRTASPTATMSISLSETTSSTSSISSTMSSSASVTSSASSSPSVSSTHTSTGTPSSTSSSSISPSVTSTGTVTVTGTLTGSSSATFSPTASLTTTSTGSSSISSTMSSSVSASTTTSSTVSATVSSTPSATLPISLSPTSSPSVSATVTASSTLTASVTATFSPGFLPNIGIVMRRGSSAVVVGDVPAEYVFEVRNDGAVAGDAILFLSVRASETDETSALTPSVVESSISFSAQRALGVHSVPSIRAQNEVNCALVNVGDMECELGSIGVGFRGNVTIQVAVSGALHSSALSLNVSAYSNGEDAYAPYNANKLATVTTTIVRETDISFAVQGPPSTSQHECNEDSQYEFSAHFAGPSPMFADDVAPFVITFSPNTSYTDLSVSVTNGLACQRVSTAVFSCSLDSPVIGSNVFVSASFSASGYTVTTSSYTAGMFSISARGPSSITIAGAASPSVDFASRSAQFDVHFGPSLDSPAEPEASFLSCTTVSSTAVALTWGTATGRCGVPVAAFVVEMERGLGNFLTEATVSNLSQLSLTVSGRNPNTAYTFRVYAQSFSGPFGRSAYSNVVTCTTPLVANADIFLTESEITGAVAGQSASATTGEIVYLVANGGNSTAQGVVLTLTPPPGVVATVIASEGSCSQRTSNRTYLFDARNPRNVTYSNSSIVCQLGAVNGGSSSAFRVKFTVHAGFFHPVASMLSSSGASSLFAAVSTSISTTTPLEITSNNDLTSYLPVAKQYNFATPDMNVSASVISGNVATAAVVFAATGPSAKYGAAVRAGDRSSEFRVRFTLSPATAFVASGITSRLSAVGYITCGPAIVSTTVSNALEIACTNLNDPFLFGSANTVNNLTISLSLPTLASESFQIPPRPVLFVDYLGDVSDSNSRSFRVQLTPAQPAAPSCFAAGSESLTLAFQETSGRGEPVDSYELLSDQGSGGAFTATTAARPGAVVCSVTVAGLDSVPASLLRCADAGPYLVPNASYQYAVRARSVNGYSAMSSAVTCRTALRTGSGAVITLARFSSSGGGLVIDLSADTDRGVSALTGSADPSSTAGQVALCAALFTPSFYTTLGSNPRCSFQTSAQLRVTLGGVPTVKPGDLVLLRNDTLMVVAASGTLASYVNGRRPILQPLVALLPSAAVRGPQSIGSLTCRNPTITLDASQSNGNGRAVSSFAWSLVNDPTGVTSFSQDLDDFIRANGTGSSVVVDANLMDAGFSYTFQVTVTNFLGYTSSASLTVAKLANEVPNLQWTGSSVLRNFRDAAVSLTSTVQRECPSSSPAKLFYRWSALVGTSASSIVSSIPAGSKLSYLLGNNSVDTGRKDLNVPAQTLTAGRVYAFTLYACYNTSGCVPSNFLSDARCVCSNQQAEVTVLRKALRVSVDGGATRRVGKQRVVTVAATGVDENCEPSCDSSLSRFAWSCSTYSSPALAQAAVAAGGAGRGLGASPCGLSVSPFDPTARSFNVTFIDAGYFVLTVSFSRTDDTSGATPPSSTVMYEVLEDSVPIVSVTLDSAVDPDSVNPSAVLVLSSATDFGTAATSSNPFNYYWTVVTEDLSFNLSRPSVTRSRSRPSLVISADSLRGGFDYHFALSAWVGSNVANAGLGTADIHVNAPPSPGSCSVSPLSGDIDTTFSIQCVGWTDDDVTGQLRYRFNLVTGSSSSPLSKFSTGSGAEVSLPTGVEDLSYLQTLSVDVRDSSDSLTVYRLSQQVTVRPISLPVGQSAADVASSRLNQLDDLLSDGNTDAASAKLLSIMSLVTAPASNAGLNASEIAEQNRKVAETLSKVGAAAESLFLSQPPSEDSIAAAASQMKLLGQNAGKSDSASQAAAANFLGNLVSSSASTFASGIPSSVANSLAVGLSGLFSAADSGSSVDSSAASAAKAQAVNIAASLGEAMVKNSPPGAEIPSIVTDAFQMDVSKEFADEVADRVFGGASAEAIAAFHLAAESEFFTRTDVFDSAVVVVKSIVPIQFAPGVSVASLPSDNVLQVVLVFTAGSPVLPDADLLGGVLKVTLQDGSGNNLDASSLSVPARFTHDLSPSVQSALAMTPRPFDVECVQYVGGAWTSDGCTVSPAAGLQTGSSVSCDCASIQSSYFAIQAQFQSSSVVGSTNSEVGLVVALVVVLLVVAILGAFLFVYRRKRSGRVADVKSVIAMDAVTAGEGSIAVTNGAANNGSSSASSNGSNSYRPSTVAPVRDIRSPSETLIEMEPVTEMGEDMTVRDVTFVVGTAGITDPEDTAHDDNTSSDADSDSDSSESSDSSDSDSSDSDSSSAAADSDAEHDGADADDAAAAQLSARRKNVLNAEDNEVHEVDDRKDVRVSEVDESRPE